MFGPVILVGSGGVLTEILDDVTIRLVPIDRPVALAMIDALRSAPMLAGARGRPPADRTAIADLIVAVAGFGAGRPDVIEIDLNPVIAGPAVALGVDALIVFAGGTATRGAATDGTATVATPTEGMAVKDVATGGADAQGGDDS
jgi:hypothetical protein